MLLRFHQAKNTLILYRVGDCLLRLWQNEPCDWDNHFSLSEVRLEVVASEQDYARGEGLGCLSFSSKCRDLIR